MPRVPKWIGDAMENIFASKILPVTVTETEYLTPQIKRIRFEGDLAHAGFQAGYAVSFRVNDTDFRHYTPLAFNKEEGYCDIIFHLHGNGPGSLFADRLKTGDQVKMMAPGGKKMYREDSPLHFFSGDETALGLFLSISERVLERSGQYTGILEVETGAQLPPSLQLTPYILDRNSKDKATLVSGCLDEIRQDMGNLWQDMTCYLAGNASSIQMVRKGLLARGVSSRNILTQAYWTEGKIGL